jgi:hypothetical protein
VFIKDVKSSNGTFINGERLSPEAAESDIFELHTDDVVVSPRSLPPRTRADAAEASGIRNRYRERRQQDDRASKGRYEGLPRHERRRCYRQFQVRLLLLSSLTHTHNACAGNSIPGIGMRERHRCTDESSPRTQGTDSRSSTSSTVSKCVPPPPPSLALGLTHV